GLSGKTRIQTLPPRLTCRVMAIRPDSICRAVIHAGSRACRAKSPKAIVSPPLLMPARRPRCCFLNLTFFGINMMHIPRSGRRPTRLLLEEIALVDPHLDADDAVGRPRFGETELDVRLQGVQRQPTFLVPLGARDLGTAEPPGHHDLDSLAAEAERRLHRLFHGATERHSTLELAGDRLRNQLRVELGPLNLLNVDVHLAAGLLDQIVAQLVDLRALAADDDAGPRGVDGHPQLVCG